MARRFGSAMTSNADSTLLIYPTEHMLVKVYNGLGAKLTVSVGARPGDRATGSSIGAGLWRNPALLAV